MALPRPTRPPASMLRRVLRFAGLDRNRRGLFLRAAFLLWKHRVLLWARPFRMPEGPAGVSGAASFREGPVAAGDGATRPRPSPPSIGWAVGSASRVVPRSTCLVQALAAHDLCRRFGYHPRLRLGARRDAAGQLEAHAWLELEDDVVVGGVEDLSEYSVFRPGTEMSPDTTGP